MSLTEYILSKQSFWFTFPVKSIQGITVRMGQLMREQTERTLDSEV